MRKINFFMLKGFNGINEVNKSELLNKDRSIDKSLQKVEIRLKFWTESAKEKIL